MSKTTNRTNGGKGERSEGGHVAKKLDVEAIEKVVKQHVALCAIEGINTITVKSFSARQTCSWECWQRSCPPLMMYLCW